MKIKPMLGAFAIDGIEYIESSESRALVEHRVPGLAGNYFQDMGTVPNTIVIAGTKHGDEARDDFLTGIREIFNKGEQTTFVADINTATDITDVIIEDLEVAEIGNSSDSFRYLIKLRKYIKPPDPPQTSLLDAGILGDALKLVDALNALDALSSISNLGDPTGPVRGALDAIKSMTGGLDQTVKDLGNLFAGEPRKGAPPAPGAAGTGTPPGAPGAGTAPGAGGVGTAPGAAGAGTSPGTTGAGTAAPSAPAPSAASIDPADPRFDAATGQALQHMLETPGGAESASPLVGAVQNGTLAGISGDDSDAAQQLAAAHGTQPSQLIPSGQDAALVLDPTAPFEAPPTILLRQGVSEDPARLGPALGAVNQTFGLFQRKELASCDGTPSTVPVPNLTPSNICRVLAAAPVEVVSAARSPLGEVIELEEEPVGAAGETLEVADEVIEEGTECPTVLDVGFVHFNNDRHVLMPEGPTPDAGGAAPGGGVDGLDVLASALDHARQHPAREMLVTGHGDTPAAIQYNLQASARRADSVFFVLQGHIHKEEWVKSALINGGQADDWRRILRWIHARFGLDCEASDPLHPNSALDFKAIHRFQRDYNAEVDQLAQSGANPFAPGFTEKIPPAQLGFVGISTWRAFFDFYQRELMRQLELATNDELRQIQDAVKFVKIPTQGCGEFHSRNLAERQLRRASGYKEKADPPQPKDRRVEIIFFDPGEAPPFDCHPTTDVLKCNPIKCLLYEPQFFAQRQLPVLGAAPPAPTIALKGVEVSRRRQGKVVFTDGRNFSPLVKEKARFSIRLEQLPVPFEGTLRVILSRPIDQGFARVAILERGLCLPTETQVDVEVEWDGTADRDVPRQLSARTTPDLNKNGAPVNIPLREMSKGDNVRHGVYVIERIELAEKDGGVIASHKPDDPGLVVSIICTLFYDQLFVQSLRHFGIGDGVHFDAPYFEDIRNAILAVLRSYYGDLEVRFSSRIATQKPNFAGIRINFRDTDATSPLDDGGIGQGSTDLNEKGNGFAIRQNIFVWCEESFFRGEERFIINVGPSGMLNRNEDQNSDDSKALHEVFGPLGVPRDSKNNPFREGKAEVPKPPRPRTVTAGRVEGEVTDVDAENTSVSLSDAGVFTVTTTNTSLVPAQRAADIQRALNAFTNAVGTFAAHELGHGLGLVAMAKPGITSIDVPGKGSFLSPLAGDEGSHNRPPQGGLMDQGSTIRLRTLFTPGNRLPLGASNRRYLADCLTRSL